MAETTRTRRRAAMTFYAIRMPADMRDRLRQVAEKRTFALGTPVPMSSVIRQYLTEGLRREQKGTK